MTLPRIVFLVVAVAALVAASPSLLGNADNLRDQLSTFIQDHGGSGGQSAEQISGGEFASAEGGMKDSALRALVGAPADKTTVRVEGLQLECWYYGVASQTGAYQFCFVNGRLTSKRRFAAPPPASG